jgi:hypothetical protein
MNHIISSETGARLAKDWNTLSENCIELILPALLWAIVQTLAILLSRTRKTMLPVSGINLCLLIGWLSHYQINTIHGTGPPILAIFLASLLCFTVTRLGALFALVYFVIVDVAITIYTNRHLAIYLVNYIWTLCTTARSTRMTIATLTTSLNAVAIQLAEAREEAEELREAAELNDCSICYATEADTVYVRCGHIACCLACAITQARAEGHHEDCICDARCPVCRTRGVFIKVYRA